MAISVIGSIVFMGSEAMVLGTAMSWHDICLVLLGISIGVGIIIALVSNNPLEEWIENSIWGNDAIYKNNYEKDMKEYKML